MRKAVLILLLSLGCNFSYSQKDSSFLHIYFQFDKYNLSDSSAKELGKILIDKSKLEKIKIEGFADHVGSNSYNNILSLNRARTAYTYLIEKGLDTLLPHEISGLGKRNLVMTNEEHNANTDQLNRVVEITAYYQRVSNKNELIKPKDSLPVQKKKDAVKESQIPQKSFEQQLQEGNSNIVLNNLNFIGGRHILLSTSIPILESVLETMKKYPTLEVEIQGHICCADISEIDGTDLDTNEKALSVNRAKAIYEYLVSNGINANRLTYNGFGSRNRLINPERNEADYSLNRRVEFKIIKR